MASMEASTYSADELRKLKDDYAHKLARGLNPLSAACVVMREWAAVANNWEHDPYVIERRAFYTFDDTEFATQATLTKDQFALFAQQQMLDPKNPLDFRYKMSHLYARVQNFDESMNSRKHGGNIINNGMIIVSNNGTDEEWERGAREQQMKLVASVKD